MSWKELVGTALDVFHQMTLEPAISAHDLHDDDVARDIVRSSLEDPIESFPLSALIQRSRTMTLVLPGDDAVLGAEVVEAIVETVELYAGPGLDFAVLVTASAPGLRSELTPTPLHLIPVKDANIPIIAHDPAVASRQAQGLRAVGERSVPVPVWLNPRLLDSDLVVVADRLELRHEAGLAGGLDRIALGCSGPPTRMALERIASGLSPSERLGDAGDNALQTAFEAIASRVSEVFCVIEAVGKTGKAFVSGDGTRALQLLAHRPEGSLRTETERYDAAVIWVPAERSQTLPEALLAYTLLALQPFPPLEESAPVLLVAECTRGLGHPAVAEAFVTHVTGMPRSDLHPGYAAQRSYARRIARHVRRAADSHPLHIVGAEVPDALDDVLQRHATLEEACEAIQIHARATSGTPEPSIMVTRHLFHSLPSSEPEDAERPWGSP